MQIGIGLDILQSLGASSGPTVASLLAELNAFDATVASWNVTDSSTTSMSAERLSVAAVTPGGPLGQLFDQKGSLDLVAPTDDTTRPTYLNGLVFAGGDILQATLPTGNYSYIFIYQGTGAGQLFKATDNAPLLLTAVSGNATPLPSQAYVDGVALDPNTRGGLYDAITDDEYHIVEVRGFAWTSEPMQALVSLGGLHCPVGITNTAAGDYATALPASYALAEKIREEIIAGN